jgi:V/A-type H+/Na+-transporting ATPase subunit D
MALRIPPGRAGRTWLVARLEIAARGAELLDRKRQALLRERQRLRRELEEAQMAWHAAAAEVAHWTIRSAILDGSTRLELLARHVHGQATVQLSWSNLMGARMPAADQVEFPETPPLSALGASSAMVLLDRACREAARAAVRCAAAERAEAEVAAELGRAVRRLRALEDRWIPQHEQALAQLDLALDESQREQAARVRWLIQRRAASDT